MLESQLILKFNIIYLVRVLNIYVYYRLFGLREWIFQSNFTSKAKPEMCDMMRNPFQTKHINDRFFIEDLVISVVSCKLVLLVEETGVLGEIHPPAASH